MLICGERYRTKLWLTKERVSVSACEVINTEVYLGLIHATGPVKLTELGQVRGSLSALRSSKPQRASSRPGRACQQSGRWGPMAARGGPALRPLTTRLFTCELLRGMKCAQHCGWRGTCKAVPQIRALLMEAPASGNQGTSSPSAFLCRNSYPAE